MRASLTWLGQMGLKVRIGGTTVFVDYFASDHPGRQVAPPIPAEEVAGVDAFLGTHDHLDHIDHEAWKVWARTRIAKVYSIRRSALLRCMPNS